MSVIVSALLAAVFSGIAAVLVTLGIERFGGVVGGVLATIPSTIVPASLGLAYAHGPDDVWISMFMVPVGLLIDVLFLLTWKLGAKYCCLRLRFEWRLVWMICLSLLVWTVLATVSMVGLRPVIDAGHVTAVGFICQGFSFLVGLIVCWHPGPAPKGSNPITWTVLIARSIFAGASIFVAVVLGEVSSSLAGLFSTFPSIFMTTMVALWLAQGEAVTTGAIGPMMLGSQSVMAYALLFAVLCRVLAPWQAAGLAWALGVLGVSLPIVAFLRYKQPKEEYTEVNESEEDSGESEGSSDTMLELEINREMEEMEL